jgi:hypothetical protein
LAFLISLGSKAAELSADQVHALKFNDVDGNKLSTADGHVSVLVLTTKPNLRRAEMVGDRVPDYCLGNSTYRMITLVKFGQHTTLVRAFLTSMARRRLDAEAKQLQKRYAANKIEKNARRDVFAVVDFDGSLSSQLNSESSEFRVFVLGRHGELLKQWNEVPTADELSAALKM